MKIVIPDKIEFTQDQLTTLKSLGQVKIYNDTVNDPGVIYERIKDANIVTANFIDLPASLIKRCKKLKYIIAPSVGFEWIDSAEAHNQGIKVINCPTYNSQAVAEHAIGLIFAVHRKIVNAHNKILNGRFFSKDFQGTEVQGKLLTTLGHGNIGKRILKMAKGIGMRTQFINTKTSAEKMKKMIAETDVLVLCLPLTPKTKGILEKKKIASMKRSAVVINVARGLVVDQDALFHALKQKKIAGAGIDTFPNDETGTKPNKNVLRFAKLENVVATPHLAYNTKEALVRLGDEVVANIEACVQGKPKNVVVL